MRCGSYCLEFWIRRHSRWATIGEWILSEPERLFDFLCTVDAKAFLLSEGTDPKYGARPLKRAIERHLVFPLSSLISSGQVQAGDTIDINLAKDGRSLIFTKEQHEPSG